MLDPASSEERAQQMSRGGSLSIVKDAVHKLSNPLELIFSAPEL